MSKRGVECRRTLVTHTRARLSMRTCAYTPSSSPFPPISLGVLPGRGGSLLACPNGQMRAVQKKKKGMILCRSQRGRLITHRSQVRLPQPPCPAMDGVDTKKKKK